MNPILLITSDMPGTEIASNVAAAAAQPEKLSILKLAMEGGWIMIVLAALLVLALYITIERWLTISKAMKSGVDNAFMDKIRKSIHEGNVEEARKLAQKSDTPLAHMIGKGLSRLGRPLPDIQAAIENVGRLEVAELEKRVSLVATVASLGPMIGFLGTVIGMVMAFDQIQAEGDIGPTTVANGMKVALITTIFGIITALILQLFYNYVLSKIDHLTAQMEESSITLMDIIQREK